ncbi:MAG TPA: hypothetical protein DD622_00265 [Opitutae bacterium]|nr:hypothetical protein [Opitutae bacterium]|tara:strand:+ start:18901 stop:19803 length:903 start_codon:yes stop_codon:yes gene_type:complete
MNEFIGRCKRILLLLVFVPGLALSASEWWQGAFIIRKYTEGIDAQLLGGQQINFDEAITPIYASGLIKLSANEGESIFLSASNGLSLYFEGLGDLAFERFEQLKRANSNTIGPSNVILNFRSGVLLIDNRSELQDSNLIIETPIGRLISNNSLICLKINQNTKNQLIKFSFLCEEGTVTYALMDGSTYSILQGQRMIGVGTFDSPMIEISEALPAMKIDIERFESVLEKNIISMDEMVGLESYMKKMYRKEALTEELIYSEATLSEQKQPMVIEYVPRPQPVEHYRGALKPLTVEELELF